MMMLEICEKYHWDYYTFNEQPTWVISMIIEKMRIDAKKAKQKEALNKNTT